MASRNSFECSTKFGRIKIYMKNKKTLNLGHIIVFIFFGIIMFFIIKDIVIKNDIEKSNEHIVVKFILKERLPKTTNFWFTYFINGKKISTANSGISYSISNSKSETEVIDNLKINGFYLAKYVPENPDIIIVNPLKQIMDTTAILKAGFSREDVEKK